MLIEKNSKQLGVMVLLCGFGMVIPTTCHAMSKNECVSGLGGSNVEKIDDFRRQSRRFLQAVAARDKATFLTYFKHGLAFYAVLPGGKVFDTVDKFLKSQDDWFDGTTGVFNYDIRHVAVAGETGFLTADVVYENVGVDGRRFKLTIYISFVFEHHGDQWFVVHDQNSVIAHDIF